MPRGRPVHSIIRNNILEILLSLGKGYGYQVAKVYNEVFPEVSQRSIYYHLKKGIETKEIEIHGIEEEKGQYSWGNTVEKVYYTLGRNASPQGNKAVEDYLQRYHQEWQQPPPVSKKKFTDFVKRFRKGK
ncbi:hypothetical protein COV20_04710 [Candidatus Woesearchaeota archaeon CG10_big_fil_rev_8_21_14_0_10_45_16]|nr:MAG: hypothetical protein COV20_04710 [Candidatus Woesearchaeota archaeon CG10_big_fil_rev_8_21_14_0_10_45_16]